MLNDLAEVIESEDVDARILLVTGPGLSAVQHDVVAFSNRTDELDMLAEVVAGHTVEVVNEPLFAVGDMGLCWM